MDPGGPSPGLPAARPPGRRMTEDRRTRASNGESSIYQDASGVWHGWVTMGIKANGQADRRHRQGKARKVVADKVSQLEAERNEGHKQKAGGRQRVSDWVTYWLENVLEETTADDYRTLVETHIVPDLGGHWLEMLEPEHVEVFYRKLRKKGLAPSSVLKIHRVLSRALKVAHQRGKVKRNVCTLLDSPSVPPSEAGALTGDQARAVIAEAVRDSRSAARWAFSLETGARQGETLGLQWPDLHLDEDAGSGYAVLRRQLKRSRARHGCEDRSLCPAKQPIRCPQAIGGGLVLVDHLKNRKPRTATLSEQLVTLLMYHREQQKAEREAAGTQWAPDTHGDLVFRQRLGRPIDPRADYGAWQLLLERAGVPAGGTHLGRHTAATLLLEAGIDTRVVMQILGHSEIGITSRYQHVHGSMTSAAAKQMGNVLWQ